MNARILTQDELDNLKNEMTYDKITGEFYWKESKSGRVISKPIGSGRSEGYKSVYITHNGIPTLHLLNRLAYQFENGLILDSKLEVDHIDRDKFNNKISNLRLTTISENRENRGSFKPSGEIKEKYISKSITKSKYNPKTYYRVLISYDENNRKLTGKKQQYYGQYLTLVQAMVERDIILKDLNMEL